MVMVKNMKTMKIMKRGDKRKIVKMKQKNTTMTNNKYKEDSVVE